MKLFAVIISFILACAVLSSCAKPLSDGADTSPDTTGSNVTTEADAEGEKGDTDGDGADADTEGEETKKNEETEKDTSSADKNHKEDKNDKNDKNDKGDKGDKEDSSEKNEETEKAEDNDKGKGDGAEFGDGLVLEVYLYSLSEKFYTDYSEKEGAKGKNVFHLTAYTLYSHRKSAVEDMGEEFAVPASLLEAAMKQLFGDKVTLAEQKKYINEQEGDYYDSEKDAYVFPAARSESIGDGYYLSYDHKMDIKAADGRIVAKVTVLSPEGKELSIEYTLKESVLDRYLYYRLEKVDVK